MSHKIDKRDKLVRTWLKLEKCLEDFETEEDIKKGKRPGSTYTFTKSQGINARPTTANTRPMTGITRPGTGKSLSKGNFNIKSIF